MPLSFSFLPFSFFLGWSTWIAVPSFLFQSFCRMRHLCLSRCIWQALRQEYGVSCEGSSSNLQILSWSVCGHSNHLNICASWGSTQWDQYERVKLVAAKKKKKKKKAWESTASSSFPSFLEADGGGATAAQLWFWYQALPQWWDWTWHSYLSKVWLLSLLWSSQLA